jgi:DNA-binding transcriptional ArsR family regulator
MDTFSALADPTRREILQLLEAGPMDASEISSHFSVSKPAISKHLKRLYEGTLVTRTVDAQRRIYQLDPRGLNEVDEWVRQKRLAWETRLDRLGSLLEKKNEHNTD